MNTKKIPFSPPDVGAAEAQEVTQTLLSGWITTGPRTKEFEREIAAYCHTEKAFQVKILLYMKLDEK